MQCPKCSLMHSHGSTECQRCGIIFQKYHKCKDKKPAAAALPEIQTETETGFWEFLAELFCCVKPEINPLIFAGRMLFFLVIFIWGLKFIFTPLDSNYTMQSFLHLVNLPFHEAGHILFRPFGRVMTSLGGSLAQLLMPVVCLAVFLIKTRDTFAASFALWWTGENFMDLAPYINDARSLTLPLLGGNTGRTSPYGYHDWEFILKETGLIRCDHILAKMSHTIGAVIMICAIVWGGYLLFKQYKNLDISI